MENLVSIELFGRSYTFKTEMDVEKAKAVADIMKGAVHRIQEKPVGQVTDTMKLNVLMLAALNMACDIYDFEKNQSEFMARLNEKSARLSQLIDDGFKENQKT